MGQFGWLGSHFEFITCILKKKLKIRTKNNFKRFYLFQVHMKRYKFLTNGSTWLHSAGNWTQGAPLSGHPIHNHKKEAFNISIGNFIARKQSTFLSSEEKQEGEVLSSTMASAYSQPHGLNNPQFFPDSFP